MGPSGVVPIVTCVAVGIKVGAPGTSVGGVPMATVGKGVVFRFTNVAVAGIIVGVAVAGKGVGEKESAVSVSCAATVAAAEVNMATGSTSSAAAAAVEGGLRKSVYLPGKRVTR